MRLDAEGAIVVHPPAFRERRTVGPLCVLPCGFRLPGLSVVSIPEEAIRAARDLDGVRWRRVADARARLGAACAPNHADYKEGDDDTSEHPSAW